MMAKPAFVGKVGLFIASLVALLCLGLSLAQGQVPTAGGTLNVAISSSPPTLDIQTTGSEVTRFIMWNVFDSLVTINEQYKPVPDLATNWDISSDGLTYTFHLRQGVLFQNGQPMTADDVKASFERYMRVGRRKEELAVIKSITVVDPYTLQIVLKHDTAFLPVLASPSGEIAVMPKSIADMPVSTKSIPFVGTGPYKFVKWVPDQYIELQKYDQYKPDTAYSGTDGMAGKKVAYFDTIKFMPMPDPNSMANALETGQVDVAFGVPASNAQALKLDPNVTLVKQMPTMKLILNFNHMQAPTNELKIRQAIQAAINAQSVLEIASDGVFQLDHNILYRNSVWASEAGAKLYNQGDLAKAKELLKEAGYNGQPIVIITNNQFQSMYKMAQVVGDTLRKMGMTVSIKVYDAPGMWAKAKGTSGWNLETDGWISLFDPTWWGGILLPEGSIKDRWTHYDSQSMDQLVNAVLNSDNLSQRQKLESEIQQKVWNDAVFYPMGDIGDYVALNSNVHGFKAWLPGPRFWNVWRSK